MNQEIPLEIRRAKADEAPLVAVLVARLLAELGGAEIDAGALLQTTRRLVAAGEVAPLLAFAEGRPVGVVTLNQCAAIYAGGRFGEICELYVEPDLRSAGVGRKLIAAARAYAREAGWPRLEVGAPDLPRWRRTVDFYLASGFTEVGPRLSLATDDDDGGAGSG
jgi:GNAT superfamily N-acetyltransferase